MRGYPTPIREAGAAVATHLAHKTALAALAAAGVFLPFGAVLPGVAGAAPSSSSGAKLRECLRASADLHQTTFGGRYVTAEDVARCMEAFRPGSSGGASGGGNQAPPSNPTAGGGGNTVLPGHLQIKGDNRIITDCRVDGNSVTCTQAFSPPVPDAEWNSTVTGTLSGRTMTGTQKGTLRSGSGAGCTSYGQHSGPVTYVFEPDGTVVMRIGPLEQNFTYSGCLTNAPDQSTEPVREATGAWSPVG